MNIYFVFKNIIYNYNFIINLFKYNFLYNKYYLTYIEFIFIINMNKFKKLADKVLDDVKENQTRKISLNNAI